MTGVGPVVESSRYVSRLTTDTVALVLAGGRGSRLHELTRWRAKPAVPFGGTVRIIDFALSNCINSGVRRVAILTQYRPFSLMRHVHNGWSFLRGDLGEFIELFPASQHATHSQWYAGTADAVFQNLEIIRHHRPKFVLVLASDHVYKMDYGPLLAHHTREQADISVGCVDVPLTQARSYGVLEVDAMHQVCGFEEKPEHPRPMPGYPDRALASMGIYVFNADLLVRLLEEDAVDSHSTHDFGADILPRALDEFRLTAYRFADAQGEGSAYWRDVGTLDAYWRANMELVEVQPELNLYDRDWPVWTVQEHLPAAKFVFNDEGHQGVALDSLVAAGCIVSGARVHHSLLFSDVRVESRAMLDGCVVLPHVTVGADCKVTRAIIDEGVWLEPGTIIGEDIDVDRQRFRVSDGGVRLVTPEMLGQSPGISR